jgi:hypothetical protein
MLYAIATLSISIFSIIGSSEEYPMFCDDNAFCTSYIALSQTTCIQNLIRMYPVVTDLSNCSRNPSFTDVDTCIIHSHNGSRWHWLSGLAQWQWHRGTGTSSGIKIKVET